MNCLNLLMVLQERSMLLICQKEESVLDLQQRLIFASSGKWRQGEEGDIAVRV